MPSYQPSFDPEPAQNRLLGLWRFMGRHRLAYFGAVSTLAVAAATKTVTYYLIRFLIDNVVGQGFFDLLPYVAAGFVLLASLEGLFSYASGRLAAFTSEGVARELRNYLYDHIQRLSFTYHDHTPTGELIQRVTSDVDTVRRFFAQQAIGFGRIVFLFVINFLAIASISPRLAFQSVVAVPPITAISIYFFRRISERYELFQEQDAVLSTTLQENLSGVRVVKAFARQAYERDRFERENREKFVRGKQLLLMHAVYWPVAEILAGAQMIVGFYLGARMAIAGTISVGSYLAFAGMVIWIIWPMRNLGRLIVQMSTAMVSYNRLAEVLRQERVPLDAGTFPARGDLRGEILFQDVTFVYEGSEMPALRQINLHCRAGESLALLGSTGSGKTTIVNLLPRFYPVTSGTILLDGRPLEEYPRRYLRQQIGMVEQEPFLFSRTIRENITYGLGREVAHEEVVRAAQAAAIHDVIVGFPEGYDTLVGERGVTLSGGQKQRVALARTLLKDPRILILDDATASVDTETEANIRRSLQRLMPGRTTLIITHRAQTAMTADKIVVLDKGRIVQCGTHQELSRQPGIYRQIFALQSRIEEELEADLAGALPVAG